MSNIHVNNISSYLDYYINIPDPQFAVMINGKWGSGKTYFISRQKEKWEKSIKSPKNKIAMRPIYISLYGLCETKQISQKIREELHPILYSKGAKIAKMVLIGTINTFSNCSFDINGDGNADDLSKIFDANSLFSILSKPNDRITGNKIVIFDDLERCKICLDEVFGYINDLVEHSKCHVILLCDEGILEKNLSTTNDTIKYPAFKEKLIGQTLLFKQNYQDVITKFISGQGSKPISEHSRLIIDLFISSGIENLRIIKQCISDASRFISYIKKDAYNEDNYNDYVRSLLAYFVIVYCEYKSGNHSISEFQSYMPFHDEKKAEIRNMTDKYQNILNEHNIHNSSYIIQISDIVEYVKSGFLENASKVFSSSTILNPPIASDWEDLYFYFKLEDEEFESKLEVVKSNFLNNHVEYVSIVIHVYALLLHFIKAGVINNISQDSLKTKAIEHIDNIFDLTKSDVLNKFFVHIHGAAFGKKYYDYESSEIQDIIRYAETKRENYFSMEAERYCNEFWHSLNNENFDKIYTYFEKETPNRYSKYSLYPIFKYVNPSIVADNISNLSNVNKEKLYYVISTRYHEGSVLQYLCDDLKSLSHIKDCLQEKVPHMKFIEQELTKNIIDIISSSCEMLKKYRDTSTTHRNA